MSCTRILLWATSEATTHHFWVILGMRGWHWLRTWGRVVWEAGIHLWHCPGVGKMEMLEKNVEMEGLRSGGDYCEPGEAERLVEPPKAQASVVPSTEALVPTVQRDVWIVHVLDVREADSPLRKRLMLLDRGAGLVVLAHEIGCDRQGWELSCWGTWRVAGGSTSSAQSSYVQDRRMFCDHSTPGMVVVI